MTTTLNSNPRNVDNLERQEQIQVVTFDFNLTSGTDFVVGGLPPGAMVIGIVAYVVTAFNAGTTNTLNVGITGTTAYYVSAASITAQQVTPLTLAATAVPLASATNLTVRFTQSGGAATTGVCTLVIRYVVPRGNLTAPGGATLNLSGVATA